MRNDFGSFKRAIAECVVPMVVRIYHVTDRFMVHTVDTDFRLLRRRKGSPGIHNLPIRIG